MPNARENKVGQFLKAAGKTPFDGGGFDYSFLNNLNEETTELNEALIDYINNPTVEGRAQLCKEWADVQVVLSNIAWYMGIPADQAFSRVHDNNMTKVVGGVIRRRADGKILKPDNYVKADMTGL